MRLACLVVAPSCLEFAPVGVKVILCPWPGYVSKVPFNVARPVVPQVFHPPQASVEQESSGPLRFISGRHLSGGILTSFRYASGLLRRAAWLPSRLWGLVWLSLWLTKCTGCLHLWAHFTRSMASSRALWSGASIQEVCHAVGWSSPHTFVRFYSLDLQATSGSQAFISWAVPYWFTPGQTFSSAWQSENIVPQLSFPITRWAGVHWRWGLICVPLSNVLA